MTKPQLPPTRSDAIQFRMQPKLRKMQVTFAIALILFSFSMTLVLFRRQEKSYLEYLLWVGSMVVWCYAIWYALSARLTITSTNIEFRAGFARQQIEWKHIESLVFEASGPVIYVQESSQIRPSPKQKGGKNRTKKLPLYLFMSHWKTKVDWENDPLGKEILANAEWLFKSKVI